MTSNKWLSEEQEKEANRLFAVARSTANKARYAQSCLPGPDEGFPKWNEVSQSYKDVTKYLEETCSQTGHQPADLPNELKLLAVHSIAGYYYCKLQTTKGADPEVLEYDSSKRVNQWIKSLEREISSYRIRKGVVWNILQCIYDQWGDERRNDGLKSEADELQYHMLKARMRWRLWRLFPQELSLSGFIQTICKKLNACWSRIRASRSCSQACSQTLNGCPGDGALSQNHDLLRIVDKIKKLLQWIGYLFDFLRAWVEWALYLVGKGLFWPFLVFVVAPIIVFAFVYDRLGCIVISDPVTNSLVWPAECMRFWYSLYYSVFVFTGSEAGAVTSCGDNPYMIGAMALEAVFAYIFMVVVIGYMVNRLSSR